MDLSVLNTSLGWSNRHPRVESIEWCPDVKAALPCSAERKAERSIGTNRLIRAYLNVTTPTRAEFVSVVIS